MKQIEKLPINLGGIVTEECSDFEKVKWYLVVILLYITINVISGKYKEMLHCGIIVVYNSYANWQKNYFLEVTKAILLVVTINYITVFANVKICIGLLSMTLIVLNYIMKGLLFFFLSNQKNHNYLFCLFLILEVLSNEDISFLKNGIFVWSELNKSSLVTIGGYNVINVVVAQAVLIVLLYNVKGIIGMKHNRI